MAKLVGDAVISLDELSQEIDMTKYFGDSPTQAQLETFAEIAVELINNRTLDNNEVGGKKKFTQYSKEYAKKKGVSRRSVDLFLNGTMLNSVVASPSSDTTVGIILDGSDVDLKKGYNHQVGDTLPSRQWFGLTDNEAQTIADVIGSEDETALDALDSVISATTPAKKATSLAQLEAALDELDIEQVF